MIRQLSQCPYCQRCEIALDDHPRIAFNPGTSEQAPCEHLVWIGGRYSQWELGDLGVSRTIGSTELSWDHPAFGAVDGEHTLASYLRELVSQGESWQHAPKETFAIRQISAEEKGTSNKGKLYTLWDVDGAAVFAMSARAFIDLLPACQARQLGALDVQ